MKHPDPTRPGATYELHPQAAQAAEPYRLRPLRRIRNLIDHVDTAYRALDAVEDERQMLAEEVIRLKRRLDGFKSSPPIVIVKMPSLPMQAAMQMREKLPLDYRLGMLTKPEHLHGIGRDVEIHQLFGGRLIGRDPADRRMSEMVRDRFNNVTYWECDDVVLHGKLEPAQVVSR